MKRTIALALTALLIAGCGGGDDEQEPLTSEPPVGTFVSTKDWEGNGSAFSTPVTVTIQNSSLGWQGNCNDAGANGIRITADRLVVDESNIASTLVGCSGDAEQQDKDLAAFFRSNPYWQLDGNRLTLSNDSVQVALTRDQHPS